jgi:hypothetical protein
MLSINNLLIQRVRLKPRVQMLRHYNLTCLVPQRWFIIVADVVWALLAGKEFRTAKTVIARDAPSAARRSYENREGVERSPEVGQELPSAEYLVLALERYICI